MRINEPLVGATHPGFRASRKSDAAAASAAHVVEVVFGLLDHDVAAMDDAVAAGAECHGEELALRLHGTYGIPPLHRRQGTRPEHRIRAVPAFVAQELFEAHGDR